MNKTELMELSDLIAEKTAKIVLKQLGKVESPVDKEMVTAAEAAHILGVTPVYMRQIKDRFPHIKVGNHRQGRVLFSKADLLESYARVIE